jgi:selenocysteine lyase/cysteine desulfurase
MGQSTITATIRQRANLLQTLLRQMDKVQLYYDESSQCGIVTFWIPHIPSSTIAHQLQEIVDGIAFEVSVVPATSTPLDSALAQVPDLLRASVSYTTSTQELEMFVQRLNNIISKITV